MTLWSRLRQSFWFIPGLLCVIAVLLAEGLIHLDQQLGDSTLEALGAVITRVGESGSRDLLGAIAGSMLAVASTTFSITIAVLALSSSTYGPRLVRNFMADRGNQVVLGIFLATFLYCLMVLRSIRVLDDSPGDYFVPHLAVNVAVLLAVAAISVLVYFIHHISDSVQVWTLAEQVRGDFIDAVDKLYPADSRHDAGTAVVELAGASSPHESDGAVITSQQTGYVLGVDVDALVALAQEHDWIIEVKVRPGEYVIDGAPLARWWPPGQLEAELCASLTRTVRIGRARTPEDDVEFPALLLEEMAVRALSPGTNDPYTAINALDNLASCLVVLAARPIPPPHRYDGNGRLRVIAPRISLMHLLDHLLNAMRTYALSHPTVVHRTLELVEQVGNASESPAVRLQLEAHVRDLIEAFVATAAHSRDIDALSSHAGRVRAGLMKSFGTT